MRVSCDYCGEIIVNTRGRNKSFNKRSVVDEHWCLWHMISVSKYLMVPLSLTYFLGTPFDRFMSVCVGPKSSPKDGIWHSTTSYFSEKTNRTSIVFLIVLQKTYHPKVSYTCMHVLLIIYSLFTLRIRK